MMKASEIFLKPMDEYQPPYSKLSGRFLQIWSRVVQCTHDLDSRYTSAPRGVLAKPGVYKRRKRQPDPTLVQHGSPYRSL